jgi:hypothetical protein
MSEIGRSRQLTRIATQAKTRLEWATRLYRSSGRKLSLLAVV